MRNRRKVLEKQSRAVRERLEDMATRGVTEAENTTARRCRSCGREGCPGSCWGFWKREGALGDTATEPGLAPFRVGERVVRGPDWRWGMQDGGPGRLGTVVEVKSFAGGSGAKPDAVRVQWDHSGKANLYRAGAEGCVDVARP